MRILGIDPGAHGALALLDGEQLVALRDMPTLVVRRGKRDVHQVQAQLLVPLLRGLGRIDLAVIEQVGAMPGQGVASMFAFGRAAGILEGVLAGMGIPFHLVSPATWKREIGVNSAKDSSRHRALGQWPHRAEMFSRSKDDGRAEAALIGLYGARKYKNAVFVDQATVEALAAL